jgi:hypothetical protein
MAKQLKRFFVESIIVQMCHLPAKTFILENIDREIYTNVSFEIVLIQIFYVTNCLIDFLTEQLLISFFDKIIHTTGEWSQ